MGRAIVRMHKEYLASVIPLPDGASFVSVASGEDPFAFDFVVEHPIIPKAKEGEMLPMYTVQIQVHPDGSLSSSFYEL